jgi:hypothetical protein
MVFGSTYCLLSHLEIKEGDEFYCFEIKQSSVINWGDIFIFDSERLKTNNFLPKLVTWNGNYYSVKDKNKFVTDVNDSDSIISSLAILFIEFVIDINRVYRSAKSTSRQIHLQKTTKNSNKFWAGFKCPK